MDVMRFRAAIAALAVAASSCAGTRNYMDPAGPRFAGTYAGAPAPAGLRVVTFNVKYARNPDGAARLLRYDARLRGADLVALQEMNEAATERIARALGLNYVYYPASLHPSAKGNFGNAILSPWPITDDVKILLPHRGRWRRSLRIAVGATVHPAGREPIRFYSVHMETPFGISWGSRLEQAAAILADARAHPRVVVAGDFNSRKILKEGFEGKEGFRWLTSGINPTISRYTWDHVAVKGLKIRDCASAGVVTGAKDVSDHSPVWAEVLDEAVAGGGCP
jgi:endonuclease/exonuclease/phosphatase family metal-dependent hydrolase